MKHIVSRMSSYFPNRWPLSYLNLTKNMKTYIRKTYIIIIRIASICFFTIISLLEILAPNKLTLKTSVLVAGVSITLSLKTSLVRPLIPLADINSSFLNLNLTLGILEKQKQIYNFACFIKQCLLRSQHITCLKNPHPCHEVYKTFFKLSTNLQLLINVEIVKTCGKFRFKTQNLVIYPAHNY